MIFKADLLLEFEYPDGRKLETMGHPHFTLGEI
jgi:hypothetical protein